MIFLHDRKGVAIITVISIVGIALLMVLAYLFGMRYQMWISRAYLASVKSRYVAESLANYAISLLYEDPSKGVDSYDDKFYTLFKGSDVDSDGDGIKDSKWIYLTKQLRGAVLVEDESAKANLNCPQQDISAVINELIKEKKLPDRYTEFKSKLYSFLQGPDRAWGLVGKDDDYDNYILEHNGIDDDLDGEVDELAEGVDDPEEFVYPRVYGDDRFLRTIDDIHRFFNIRKSSVFKVFLKYFAVDSLSSDIDITDMPKDNLNYLTATQLAKDFLEVGLDSPWQKAVNLRDFVDRDFVRSQVFCQSLTFKAYSWEGSPSWKRELGNVLVDSSPSQDWEYWQWTGVAPGQYYCYLYGPQKGSYIGDVRVNGVVKLNVHSGDGITFKKIYVGKNGILKVEIRFPPTAKEKKAYFSYVELVPVLKGLAGNKPITGIEGIRISEVYSHPKLFILASKAVVIKRGSWQNSGGVFVNSDAGSGTSGAGIWEFNNIPNGVYYLKVLGLTSTSMVGDVSVLWSKNPHLRSGQWVSGVVNVYDGKLRLEIQNNEAEGVTCYFRGIVLSQEPDVEFVEISNITKKEVDLGGWFVSVANKQAFPAYIPMGTTIKPGESLILTVDGFDNLAGIGNNGLGVTKQFKDTNPSLVVNLDLPIDVKRGFDFIPDKGVLYLKNARGEIVDGVDLTSCKPFYSIYRDVLDNRDADGDGNFDAWTVGAGDDLPTPGEMVKGDENVFIKNGPIVSIGELFSVPSGDGKAFTKSDVSKIWSKLVVRGIDLYPFGHKLYGWKEAEGCLVSGSRGEDVLLSWNEQNGVVPGYYHLVLVVGPYEAVKIAFCDEDRCGNLSPLLWADSSGNIDLGWIYINNSALKIKIENASPSGKCHFYALHLAPNYNWKCRVNINTASAIDLLAAGIPLKEINYILKSRPFGVNDSIGIGDVVKVLSKSTLLRADKFLSINSNSYTIIATGQSLKRGKPESERRIWIGVERN